MYELNIYFVLNVVFKMYRLKTVPNTDVFLLLIDSFFYFKLVHDEDQ